MVFIVFDQGFVRKVRISPPFNNFFSTRQRRYKKQEKLFYIFHKIELIMNDLLKSATSSVGIKFSFHSFIEDLKSPFVSCMERNRPNSDKIAEKNRRKALRRQRKIERSEINITMRIVFGKDPPSKKCDVFEIKNVTLRQIWMEELYLYNCLVRFKPEESFHSPEKYSLRWQV